jgi:hypothetical protein
MKKIYLREEQENQAGTDFPHYYDPKTDTHYEGSWSGMYAFPFGYWPIDYGGTEMFCVGDAYTMHSNACGKAAERYFMDCMREQIEESAQNLETNLENFVDELKEYGYTYNEETDFYESADGSDEFDLEEKIDDIMDGVYAIDYDYIRECVENAIENLTYPSCEEITEHALELYASEYNFYDKDGIDEAMEQIGMDFYSYFEQGRNEGRIWPEDDLIAFYPTEQPDPNTLMNILEDLSRCDEIGLTYQQMLGFIIIFEDWRNDGEVTACTVSDYIDGNYGPESYEDDDEGEIQYARDGKTQFVPHLASPEEKREFFKDFRNTRDQAVYVPREKGAGSLARYHAMRYPYGENKKKLGKIIREEINKIL